MLSNFLNFVDKIFKVEPDSGEIKEVFLFDSDTRVGLGFREAGTRKGFSVKNLSRTLVVKSFKRRFAESWVEVIKKNMERRGTTDNIIDILN